ncbi:MAG: hypothetical protein ABI743_05750 [bacterium]
MKAIVWGITSLLTVLGTAYGCSGGGDTPLVPAGGSGPATTPTLSGTTPELSGPVISGGLAQSSLGVFHVEVDTTSGSARTTLARSAQSSDNTYELSIENFLTTDSLRIDRVEPNPSTIDLHFTVTHPLPAPFDLHAPASAANRADLGAALRLLLFTTVDTPTGHTFFAGDSAVIANTTLVANPDGYCRPAGLLQLPGDAVANTFPYVLVVDEAANDGSGNRVGIAGVLGNDGRGNYDPQEGGWQGSNIGGHHDGWTGYGVLHQGQSATSVVRLSRAALGAGEHFSFDAALLAKYMDPRGGTSVTSKRANRLPQEPVDTASFSYRMPYGALDCEAVRFEGESGGLAPGAASVTTLRFHVRDWDARATETTLADLGLDPNISFVQRAGSGAPVLSVDIPGVLTTPVTFQAADLMDNDSAYGGDAAVDTGAAGDELFFQHSIAKPALPSETSGLKTGLLRVQDVEAFDGARGEYYTALAHDLVPLAPELVPAPETFLPFQVLVVEPNLPPSATAQLQGGVTSIRSGATLSVLATSYTDAESNPGSFEVDFRDEGGFFSDISPVTVTTAGPFPFSLGTSPPIYNNSSASPILATCAIHYNDAFHPAQTISIPFTLQGNEPPSGTVHLLAKTVQILTPLTLVFDSESDRENNEILWDVDWEWDGIPANFQPDAGYSQVLSTVAQIPHDALGIDGGYLAGVRYRDAFHDPSPVFGLVYTVVPPNGQGHATFATPPTVVSGTTTTVTVSTYVDPDGDPLEILIDWNGDGDYLDAGEFGLPPVTGPGQVYTSPIMYNNTSATALPPRELLIEITDGISPHDPITISAGTFTLGGNRTPVITGSPSLQQAILPPPAIFNVLQNTLSATDPEGNPLTFTVKQVPNSGTASNLTFAAFPKPATTFMYPSVSGVQFTVYVNDALHATTAGTATSPVLAGTICTLYVLDHNFDTSDLGWTPGFGGLSNTDTNGWSGWRRCTSLAGLGLTGSAWTTGPDSIGPCDNHPDDYGPNADNNLVSPSFSLAGTTQANLVLNSAKTGRGGTTAHYRILISTTNGTSWSTLNDSTKAASTILNENNLAYSLNAYVGQPNLRLRFQFQDTATATWGASPYAGWSIDAVRITACP